jgi:hypothetical protein
MNESEISHYITETFEGVDIVTDAGNSFFFYNPASDTPPDHRFPFVTLVTNDLYDQFSNLSRPSTFRLNIGISKQTFHSLFGISSYPSSRDSAATSDKNANSYDFTTLNQLMPHPEYGRMFWLCILNPSEETFATQVHPLLAEAYDIAVSKRKRRNERK